MSPGRLVEQDIEEAALAWLASSGFSVVHGPEIAIGQPGQERSDPTYRDVVLPVNQRLTLANMAVEAGAKAGLVASDYRTRAYLARQAREADWQPLAPDAGAEYERTLRYDASLLVPMVAAPHTVDNSLPAGQVAGVRVQQVLIGTCTNGRLEDLRAAAGLLRGRRRAPHTRLIVTPASQAIYKAALAEGLLDVFVDAGAVVTGPGCGACVGVHAGVLGAGEVCVSTANRNFKGRMGNPHGAIYLASPLTAAAAAVAGEIVDPRELLGSGELSSEGEHHG